MILRIGYPAQAEARTGRRPWRDATGWVSSVQVSGNKPHGTVVEFRAPIGD